MTFDDFATQLRERSPLPPLFPQSVWNLELSRALTATPDDTLFGNVQNPTMAQLCRSGLLLMNDDLDAAHAISQKHEGDQTADYWHAILHRREGDASNALYWWRRVGAHPAFRDVCSAAYTVLEKTDIDNDAANDFDNDLQSAQKWRPELFTTVCDRARNTENKPENEWLLRVQLAEINALLDWCRARVTT